MSTQPVDRTSVRSGLLAPIGVGLLGLGAAALLHTRDPHDAGSYGFCPFLSLTGQPCPGCGGLRAVNDLTRGDVVSAVSSNALAVAFVASIVVLWAVWTVRRARGDCHAVLARVGSRTAIVVVSVAAIFGIARVTPWGSWLAP